MCGRTFCAIDPRGIQKSCEYTDPATSETICPQWCEAPTGEAYRPSYNIAPTIFTPVIMHGEHCAIDKIQQRVIQPMRWGLVPQWHKGNRSTFKSMHNNCKGETITEKRTFSVPFSKGKRCVVLAEGFYEWNTVKGKKIPYLFTAKGSGSEKESTSQDGQSASKAEMKENVKAEPAESCEVTTGAAKSDLLFMAGIFDICKEDEGAPLYSYSILTTEAVGAVAEIHHRMPVLLRSDEDIERWLNFQQYPSAKVTDLICARDILKSHKVTDKVNNVRYQESDCPLPVSSSKPATRPKNDIRNWFSAKPEAVKRKSEPLQDVDSKQIKKEERN